MTKVMKNILFALLWAIVLVPVSAQKTLPQSAQPYAGYFTPNVANALKKAGFDLSTNATRDLNPHAQQRSGVLQLDSTKSFYGYDLTGDSLPIFRTIYQYPQPILEIQTEYQFENDVWLTLNRSNIFKDNQGRIVEIVSEAFDMDKGDFKPDSRALVFPHENSQVLVDSFYVYGWDTLATDWSLLFFSTNQYDAQDRLIISISSFDYLGQPLLFKDVYTYDANGDNTLVESFALFNGDEVPSSKRELKYDNHLVTQVVAFIPDGVGGYLAQSKITYAYTSFDKEEQVNSYEWSFDANDWAQNQGDTYGYDNAQRVNAKETVLYNQDGSEERNLSTYDYVEDDNLKSEANYYWSVSDFVLIDRKFYYYGDGTLSDKSPIYTAPPLEVSPNPTSGLARLNLEVPATIRIYNTQGEMVSNGAYQPNQTLNISDLPTGLYFVIAHSSDQAFVGRLVKE